MLKWTALEGSRNPDRTKVINKLKELINAGADVDYLPMWFRTVKVGEMGVEISPTPMTNAMTGGNLDVITLLLDSGAKLESDEYYDTYDSWPNDNWWPLPLNKQ